MKKIFFLFFFASVQIGLLSCNNSDKNPSDAVRQNEPIKEEGVMNGMSDSLNRNTNVQGSSRDSTSITNATRSGGGTGNAGNTNTAADTLHYRKK